MCAAANAQLATLGHGIPGIDHQIGKHLAYLVGGNHRVGQDLQFSLQFHVGALELPVQQAAACLQ